MTSVVVLGYCMRSPFDSLFSEHAWHKTLTYPDELPSPCPPLSLIFFMCNSCCMSQVGAEGRDAELIRESVLTEEQDVKRKQAETQVLKDEAQEELEEVSDGCQDGANGMPCIRG